MNYKLTTFGPVIRIEDGAYIPVGSGDYVAYLAWVDAGNAPQPADIPPVTFPALTPRQVRQALTRAGLRNMVETAVAAGDQDLKDWWNYASAFERLHPKVTAMGAALGVSSSSLDDLWTLGASL